MKKIIFILLLMTISAVLVVGCSNKEANILDLNLREHKDLALHIHPTVEIEILGEQYPIPINMGVSNKGMRVIHTHDTTGKLHIESPYPYQFHLKDLFTLWGENFNSTCIIEYCEDEDHSLKMTVNGIENNMFTTLPLEDKQKIKITYSKNG